MLYSGKEALPGSKLAEGHGSLLSMQSLVKDVPFVDDSALGLLHLDVLQKDKHFYPIFLQ